MRNLILATAVLGVASSSAFAQTVLFERPFDPTTAAVSGVVSEAPDGGFYNQRVADQFTLATDATVTELRWFGSEEGFFTADFPGNIAGFSLQINDATATQTPGASLFDMTVPVGDVTATSTGTTQFNDATIFEFSYTLPAGVALPAGNYTFSPAATFVAGDGSANDDSFFLAATATLGLAVASPPSAGYSFDAAANEFSYSIVGTVPEPASLSLLGLGGLALIRRRR